MRTTYWSHTTLVLSGVDTFYSGKVKILSGTALSITPLSWLDVVAVLSFLDIIVTFRDLKSLIIRSVKTCGKQSRWRS
jgi:hypothetical protein